MIRANASLVASLVALLLFTSPTADVFGQLPFHIRNLTGPSEITYIPTAGLGRGVNFGNMLEAPDEGVWGLFVEEIFFDKVTEVGMEHVRIPISWTHHTSTQAPYPIETEFFERVDEVVDLALQRGLKVIINNHHYDQLNEDPIGEQARALSIWNQIATRYQKLPDTVFFEILNEPHGEFSGNPELWDQFMVNALSIIRQTNPNRKVLVGPVFFNSIGGLATFNPPKDPNLICSVHFYDPFEFTHQGATWVNPTPPVGVTWSGTEFGLNSPWQNWSWGSTIESTSSGLEITYNEGWAGFQLHHPVGVSGANQLRFTIDQPLNLTVVVRNVTTGAMQSYSVETANGEQTYSIDISAFGAANSINNVFIQNATPSAQPPYSITQFEIVSDQPIPLIGTEADRITEAFRTALRWGLENGMPMHLGEFGAFNPGDMNSRALWTAAVRGTVEKFRIDWSYWELAAGFGFYDPENDTFRLPLLQALVPDFK